MKKLTHENLIESLEIQDLTNSLNGSHAIQLTMNKIIKSIKNNIKTDVQIQRRNSIVALNDNYNYLSYPEDGAARDSRYTKYVSDKLILRTQTSSMIPSILNDLNICGIDKDLLIACPGLVYRRDVIDKLHVPVPHQLDLWIVSNNPKDKNDLINMISIIMNNILPNYEYRLTDAEHPYTTEGVQIDVNVKGQWIEIGECGIASKKVLSISGLNIYGLAMGLGLDRITMIVKEMNDIRLLRDSDPKVKKQMLNLDKYKEVSKMPISKKDISVAVSEDMTEEELGDIVLEHYPEAGDLIEEIKVISSTTLNQLPESAIERMGIVEGQKNLLLRITLRSLSKTLTTEESKDIRNKIYHILHQGNKKEADYL